MIQRLLEFLLSLHQVRLTSNTHFAFVWSYPGLIVIGSLLLAALGYGTYTRQAATGGKKTAMRVVRGLLLIVVFMLIFRPEVVVEHEERQRSVVAVWLDNSASMQLEDPYKDPAMRAFVQQAAHATTLPAGQVRANRYQLAIAALDGAATKNGWLQTLAENQDIAIYTGSTHAQLLGIAHDSAQLAPFMSQLSGATPTGESTDAPAVISDILQNSQGQRVSALVLLTDGQTTEKGSRIDHAIATAQHANAKIFTLPLGQSDEPFDLKLANVQIPENSFVRDPVSIRAQLSASGIDQPTPAKVTLFRKVGSDMVPLLTKDYTLDPNQKTTDIELIFKPEKKNDEKSEKFELVLRVDAQANASEELTRNNNTLTAATNVLDAQINALYVDGYPRWEFRYLKNELIRERTVNVATLLLSADDDFAQEGDPAVEKEGRVLFSGPISRFPETAEELAKFDILYIGDVDPTYFSPTQQRLIVDFVGKGGGIGWIAGTGWNPEAYKGTPLDVLLPVIPDELDPRARVMAPSENTPFNPILTAAGRESNLFRFFDDSDANAKQMADLPQLYWYKPVVGLAPAAEVLAVHPTRTQGGNLVPLVVTSHYKRGRTMFSAIADTWRWRRYTGEPLFQSYWLQMSRLLYRDKALGQSKQIELAAETDRVEIGQPIKVTMDIKDPTLISQLPSQIPVLLMDKSTPGGQPLETVTLTRSANSQTQYQGVTTATQIGDEQLTIAPGILPVDVAPYSLTVDLPQREFEKLTADTESLTTISTKTSGKLLPLPRADELTKQIPDRSLPVLISNSEELWYKPIALLLVLALATTEWLLRKSAGLI